ncbi:MAG: MutS-related protein, partial [Polaribacter sp.]
MIKPLDFYAKEKTILEIEATVLKKKSTYLSIFRFAVFLTTCYLIYLTFGKYPAVFISASTGFLVFGFLVTKQLNLKRKRNIIAEKIKINATEIQVLNDNFHSLETGKEFVNSTHFYSNDIDLFGIGSFFQYINRTVTNDGKKRLANSLTENKTTTIVAKQETIKELSQKPKWRQHFNAIASLVTVKNTTGFITDWIVNYTQTLPNFLKILTKVFSIISVVLIGFVSFGNLSFSYITIWFFIGLFITVKFIKKTSNLYSETGKIRETF